MSTSTTQFLVNHGAPIVFAAVFLEQMGLPLPVVPLLLAAGALSATGKFSQLLGLGITVLACLIADTFWFYLGRYRGHRVLGLLCRISLEPDSCVRRTQNVFTRYGLRGLLVAKFVPGLGTVAPPLAGMSGVKVSRFLLADGLGSVLYGGGFIYLGYLFSNQIQQIAAALASIGGSALGLVLGLGTIYIGFKYWQRRRILRELRMARITVAELRRKQDAGEQVVIIDLRPGVEVSLDPYLIPGSVHLAVDEVEHRHHEIPRDREVIVYCSCPNEESSARVALLLHRRGITRVRPLLGGIAAWRELNYPVESASRPPKPFLTTTPAAPGATPLPQSAIVHDDSSSRGALDKAA
jgi:membrane protein DedA with SNARE-associated domain/rhodanese-related sulfurtransferase